MPSLDRLVVADAPEVWADLGFDVEDERCFIGDVEHLLVGGGDDGERGIRSWTLSGGITLGDDRSLDGLATSVSGGSPAPPPGGRPHPNGVVAIDHLVVASPDLPRTLGCFEGAGLAVRRTRDSDTYGMPLRQAFFLLGPVILELIGPSDPAASKELAGRPAGFYGLAFTVSDLDATVGYLGSRLHPAKDAVQPGRRIATLDRGAGSSVAMAFMSPA